jgi:branched-chain amino acid transport system permease protein
MLIQLFILILVTCSTYYMVALAFSISYSTTKFFNMSYVVNIVYAAYLFNTLFQSLSLNPILAAFIAICICTIFQLILHQFIFFKINNQNGLTSLVASLGILVVMQSILSIIYGDSTIVNSFFQNGSYTFFNTSISSNQLFLLIGAVLVFIVFYLVFRFSFIGKLIKAVSSNKDLSEIWGIDSKRIELISTLLSSIIFSISGILYSFYTVINPMYGFDLLLYGIIAMIIGGVGSNWGLLGGAFLLAMAQHLGSYYIDSKWMDAIAYFILILFLIWKPLGFSGKLLKKVEI